MLPLTIFNINDQSKYSAPKQAARSISSISTNIKLKKKKTFTYKKTIMERIYK